MEKPFEVSEEFYRWCSSVPSEPTALDRLAYAISSDGKPERRLMALFTAFFDASGHPADQEFVVVAGYVANYAQWQMFEHAWREAHKRAGYALPFHMTEFINKMRVYHQTNGKFDEKAEDFIEKLCSLQQLFMLFGISCIVKMSDYSTINSVLDLRKEVPPYALGARTCLASLHKWEQQFNIQDPVEPIFEDGDFERGKFIDLMRYEGGPAPIFKKKDDFAGLQAADFYAWEQLNYLKRQLASLHLPSRTSFKRILTIPHVHLESTQESLIKLCEGKGIKPR